MITDKELLKLVKYKLGIFDLSQNITEEDLQDVYELVINNISLSGQKKDVDLTQLASIPNIERLELVNFDIDDEVAIAISSLARLKHLSISDSKIQAPINCAALEYISIEDSKVKRYDYLPIAEQIDFISQNVNADELKKQSGLTKDISFYGGSVKSSYIIGELSGLESATFIETKLDDTKLPDKLKEKGIQVEYVLDERDVRSFFKR